MGNHSNIMGGIILWDTLLSPQEYEVEAGDGPGEYYDEDHHLRSATNDARRSNRGRERQRPNQSLQERPAAASRSRLYSGEHSGMNTQAFHSACPLFVLLCILSVCVNC